MNMWFSIRIGTVYKGGKWRRKDGCGQNVMYTDYTCISTPVVKLSVKGEEQIDWYMIDVARVQD